MTLAWDAEGCCLREGRTKLSPGRWAGSLEGELVGRAEALTSPTSLFGLDSAWAVGLLVSGSSKPMVSLGSMDTCASLALFLYSLPVACGTTFFTLLGHGPVTYYCSGLCLTRGLGAAGMSTLFRALEPGGWLSRSCYGEMDKERTARVCVKQVKLLRVP